MSTLKVGGIRGVSASSDAITVNSSDGTCTANITNNLSNRNLVINGAMQVAQRGTSSTAEGKKTVDMFQTTKAGTDETPQQAQVDVASGTTPYTLGFRKSFKVTNGNQTSGAGSNDMVTLNYRFEAQDIANSGWNYTSASSYITIQFWVKSSVAQNFYVFLRSVDGTSYSYPIETGSLSANTWTKVTKTIPGNSNLQIDNNTDEGLRIVWNPFLGTDRTDNGVTLNQWGAYDGNARTPDYTSTWYTTNDATFEITGVQLEVGSVATDFEHQSFAQELALCKRYYQKSYDYQTAPGSSSSSSSQITSRYANSVTNRLDLGTRFEVEMRSTPTLTIYAPINGTAARVEDYSNGTSESSGTDRTISSVRSLGRKGLGGMTLDTACDNVIGYHYSAEADL